MPLNQHVEGGHGKRAARLKIRPAPMHDLFEMAHERQHGAHRLDEQTVLPRAARTQFEIARIALRRMEGRITQDYHASIDLSNQLLKGIICHIGRGTRPPHHEAILVQQQTEFAPDDPAVVREAFATDLLGAAAFAHRVDQLDPVGVDHAEHRRSGQEGLRPVVMGREETKEPGALGEVGKQRARVARQSAIEGPVADACEGVEQPQRGHLTGPEVGLGMFRDGTHLLIDLIEQRSDKLHGDHTAFLSWEGCHAPSVEESSDDCKLKNLH
jgi:hypothetical protein